MKVIYFKEKETKSPGIWEFALNEDDYSNYLKKEPVYGKGIIKYSEGSIYKGDLFFDGKTFNKIGFGEQDFLESSLNNLDAGGKDNTILYKYVGQYDYRHGDWIYGLGTLYFLNKDKEPDSFVYGKFLGLECTKNIKINKNVRLLQGFTKKMQIKQLMHKNLVKKFLCINNKITKTLFIGDSYFEFIGNRFNIFKDSINLGIGGAKFYNFINLENNLLIKFSASRVLINLGFNDIHSGFSNRQVEYQLNKLLSFLFKKMKVKEIYILTIIHAPSFNHLINQEIDFNKYLFKKYRENKYIHIIDTAGLFYRNNRYIDDYISYFDKDLVHLNDKGYEVYLDCINNAIK